MDRRRRAAVAGLLALAVLVAGCASPTPYVRADNGTGYAEAMIEPRRWRVSFTGNSLTPREAVEDYLLYRAAELTLEQGYDHFVVTELDTVVRFGSGGGSVGFGTGGIVIRGKHRRRSTSRIYYRPWPGYWGWPYYGPTYSSVGVGIGYGTAVGSPSRAYTAYAIIVMRPGPPPPDDANAYDARAVIATLEPRIRRPEEG